MGNSQFLFWPDPPGGSTTRERVFVNFGRTISVVEQPVTEFQQSISTAWTGRQTIVQWGGAQQVRISHRWGSDTDGRTLRRRLEAMINHLERGGTVMFLADVDRAFAGACSIKPEHDTTELRVVPMIEDAAEDVDLTGLEVVLRSNNPDCMIESQLVSAHVQGTNRDTLTIAAPGTFFDYSDSAWVMVRERGSWPSLRLPESERGRQHLQTDHETAFTLDILLEEDEARIAAMAAVAPESEATIIPGEVEYGSGPDVDAVGGPTYHFP